MGKDDGDVEPGSGLSRFAKYSKDERERIGAITRALFEAHGPRGNNHLMRYGVRVYRLVKPDAKDVHKLGLVASAHHPVPPMVREFVRLPSGEWMKVGDVVDRWYATHLRREQAFLSFRKRNIACARIARVGHLRESTYEEAL